MEGGVGLKDIFFKKTLELLKTYFIKKKNAGVSTFIALPLQIIEKRNHDPWKLLKFVLHFLEIPHFFLIPPG